MAQDEKIKIDKEKLSKVMKDIDICMMTTLADDGHLHSRPMSNNRNVEWDGETWFFANADSSQVKDLERNPKVNLAYALTKEIVFISLAGEGEIVRDDDKKRELWYDELERWFETGPEDEKVVLIRVKSEDAYYWSKEGSAELNL